jgi:glucose/arabinose dehydrogenase
MPSGDWETFADSFAGEGDMRPESPGDAEYRPMGLAVGPDGSLYISDSQVGRIWRVVYTGS